MHPAWMASKSRTVHHPRPAGYQSGEATRVRNIQRPMTKHVEMPKAKTLCKKSSILTWYSKTNIDIVLPCVALTSCVHIYTCSHRITYSIKYITPVIFMCIYIYTISEHLYQITFERLLFSWIFMATHSASFRLVVPSRSERCP